MYEENKPIIIDFPLRGEWFSPNTPGTRIPSHGTNRFGTRYAYDFLQVDWKRKGHPNYQTHWLIYLIFGVPLQKCYCWGKNVYAPCDGTVVEAKDNYKERTRAHFISDMFVAVRSTHFYNSQKDDIQSIAGNYIIIKYNEHAYPPLPIFNAVPSRLRQVKWLKREMLWVILDIPEILSFLICTFS